MNAKRRTLALLVGCLLVIGAFSATWAGVVRPGGKGTKQTAARLHLSSAEPGSIWAGATPGSDGNSALNLEGDLNGDLWPTIAENPLEPHEPWVVWSRFNGRTYDIAWSRWERVEWGPIRTVQDNSPGDDLDAEIVFDSHGRAYMVWWRESAGRGQVFISVFLQTRWLSPFRVTSGSVDARYPSLTVLGFDQLRVDYETSAGTVTQMVEFERPVTITDDINPYGIFRFRGGPTIIQQNKP